MQITREIIDYVAELSRLELTEEEKEREVKDMGKILEYMEKLEELDTSAIEPMTHTLGTENVFRGDITEPSWEREELLKNAPIKKDGMYMVPKTVE